MHLLHTMLRMQQIEAENKGLLLKDKQQILEYLHYLTNAGLWQGIDWVS